MISQYDGRTVGCLDRFSGGPVKLINPINNTTQELYVGLCEFTYTTGWVNVSEALGNNKFAVRPSAAGASTVWAVPDGYYSVERFEEAIHDKLPGFSATLNNATGRVRFTLSDANYQLNLMSTASLWGFAAATSLGPATTYTADASPTFFPKRNLFVTLDQIIHRRRQPERAAVRAPAPHSYNRRILR
jgi:hypothetical protein